MRLVGLPEDQMLLPMASISHSSLLAQRLAIIAGAGLSMAPPSNLPSAWTLAARAKAAYGVHWGAAKPPLPDDIEA